MIYVCENDGVEFLLHEFDSYGVAALWAAHYTKASSIVWFDDLNNRWRYIDVRAEQYDV